MRSYPLLQGSGNIQVVQMPPIRNGDETTEPVLWKVSVLALGCLAAALPTLCVPSFVRLDVHAFDDSRLQSSAAVVEQLLQARLWTQQNNTFHCFEDGSGAWLRPPGFACCWGVAPAPHTSCALGRGSGPPTQNNMKHKRSSQDAFILFCLFVCLFWDGYGT